MIKKFKSKVKPKSTYSENITDVINRYDRKLQWFEETEIQHRKFTSIVVR
jgi:hypothetical protein